MIPNSTTNNASPAIPAYLSDEEILEVLQDPGAAIDFALRYLQ